MCDYSLHGVANRPAKIGDKLVSTNFVNSFTRGFTERGEPKVAVCLLPGTELVFDQPVETDHVFRRLLPRFGFGKTGQTMARFRQVNMDRPDTHHDALEFPNGKIVLVTRMCPGQKATVLQLPVSADQSTTGRREPPMHAAGPKASSETTSMATTATKTRFAPPTQSQASTETGV